MANSVFDWLDVQDYYSATLAEAEAAGGFGSAIFTVLPASSKGIHRRFFLDEGDLWVKFAFHRNEFGTLRDRLRKLELEEIVSLDLPRLKQRKYRRFRPQWWPVELMDDRLQQPSENFPYFVGEYSAVTDGYRITYYFFVDPRSGQGYCYSPAPSPTRSRDSRPAQGG